MHVKKQQVNHSAKEKLPLAVYITTVVGFFVAIGYGLIVPAIPLFAESFGVSNAAVGFIVSAFAFSRFSSGVVAGKSVEKFGERLTLGVGLFIVAASSFLSGLAQNFWQLLVFRALGGIGSMAFSVSASAIIMRVSSNSQRGRAQATYNAGFLLGTMAGPAFGGILTTISLRIPFFVYTATLTAGGATALIFLREKNLTYRHNVVNNQNQIKFREAIKLFPFRAALVFAFLTNWVTFGLRNSVLPLFVKNQLHSTAAMVGYGFTVTAVIQGLFLTFVGRLSDLRGRRFLLYIGWLATIVAVSILIAATSVPAFMISMAVFGVGAAFMGTAHANIVGDIFGGKAGKAIASWQMAGDAGLIIGPIVIGTLADTHSYRTAFIASALFFAISIYFIVKMEETRESTGLLEKK